MASQTHLKPGSISAKVCNYKSVAGVNRASNASSNTTEIYNKYGHFSIEEITRIING